MSFTKRATQFDSPRSAPCVIVIAGSSSGAPSMLQITQADVRAALANAVSARQKAEAATTPEMRAFWLDRETKWLRLAQSYDQVHRTTIFLNARKRRRDNSGS